MDLFEKAAILQYRHRRIGDPGRCVGWCSTDSQRLRFDVLCRVGDTSDSQTLATSVSTMCPSSSTKRAGAMVIFHAPDLCRPACCTPFFQMDYVLASGALSYRCRNALYPYKAIRQMWEAATRGAGFNLLEANVFEASHVLCGQNQHAILAFSRTLDPAAELVTGSVTDDFTLLMRRRSA